MGEIQLQFVVTNGRTLINIELPEFDTVGDLMREIESRLNIPFHQQNITGWFTPPVDHQTVLQLCTNPDGFQCLTVDDNCGFQADAIRSFISKFPRININIHSLGLEDALSCLKNNGVDKKSALLFYLHKDDDPFSEICMETVTEHGLSEFINRHFIFIGWNIENDSHQVSILSVLNKYTNLSIIIQLIDKKRPSLVCIYHDDKDFRAFFCLNGRKSSDDIIVSIKGAQESLNACSSNDAMEIEAITSFKNKLPSRSAVVIQEITLRNAINLICTAPLKERKAILLYLHNSSESFSDLFCANITSGDLAELLNRSFIVIGWDIEQEKYHEALRSALNNYINLSVLVESVSKKVPLAVCIMPVANNIRVFMCFKGNTTHKVMLESLSTAEKTLQSEMKEEEALLQLGVTANQADDLTAEAMQGIFAEMLCDRDFDRFEHDQHNYLKDKIGYALRGAPNDEKGYDDKTKSIIESLYNVIISTANKIAEYKDLIDIAFIYNCTEPLPSKKIERSKKYIDYNPKTDITPVPIFVLRKCRDSEHACRIFIDDGGRVYKSWEDYLTKNKLPECHMTVPLNGRYQIEDGQVLLERHLSPACHLDTKLLQVGDIASMAVGMASGVILVVAAIPAVTLAPAFIVTAAVGGLAAGVWSIGRSIHSLVDKGRHDESLSFWNSEARGAYFNIVAGALGFVGAGANVAMTGLVSRGFNISQGAAYAYNTVGVLNITASGASLLNSGYDVLDQWINENQTPSSLALLQLGSSVLFFGHAVYSFKGATTVIRETQAQVLKDYQETLRSNRHRKSFNKLMKETLRTRGDNSQTKSDIISTIRKIQNKDEVFAAFTRNNKAMNRKGIRFSIEGGEIKLNGLPVDMNEFVTLNKKNVEIFLGKINEQSPNPLSSFGAPAPDRNADISGSVRTILRDLNIDQTTFNIAAFSQDAVRILLAFSNDTRRQLIYIVQKSISYILDKSVGQLFSELNDVLPKNLQFFECLKWVISYFMEKVDNYEKQYHMYLQTKNDAFYTPVFEKISPVQAKRAVRFFEYAVKICYCGGELLPEALNAISNHVATWIVKYVYDYNATRENEQRRSNHSAYYRKQKVCCSICAGYYFEKI